MSAITVIYNLNKKPVSSAAVEEMLNILKHRGEDGVGIWVDGNIGLGHRMRFTTEESIKESFPLKSADSNCLLICDARIDNRSDLIAQLYFKNEKQNEITDSDIVLAAYEKWGKDCLPKLIGDFVFAIWDPNLKELFCARDPLGVKHFYYYYEPNKIFALSSEIKALFSLKEVPRILDEEGIGDYIFVNFQDKEKTFFKGIKRLPSTCGLTVKEDNFYSWTYWQADSLKTVRLKNHREYQEAFREKFVEAVNCRVRSAFPIGSCLSGGLDSSSIVCVASKSLAEQGKPPLHSFSGIFPTVSKRYPDTDESAFMKSVVERSGCQPHYVNCDDHYPLKDMDSLMWHADHPVGAPNMHINWEIYKEAQKQNVRVLLDGLDGDSTVSYGYEDFARFLKRGKVIRSVKEAFLLKKNMPFRTHTYKDLLLKRGLAGVLPFDAVNAWHFFTKFGKVPVKDKSVYNDISWNIVNSDFKARYNLEERFKNLDNEEPYKDYNCIQEHWAGLTGGLFAKVLEWIELATQGFSIEQRFPFFDRRLIEFCIALPPGERVYNGWTRAIFRYAMEGYLPKEVQWRKNKAFLGVGVMLNILKYGNSEVEDSINDKQGILKNYLNIETLKTVYQRHVKNPVNGSKDIMILVSAIHLSNWLRNNDFTSAIR